MQPIWLASYPRSGVTFLRHVLSETLGVPTFSVYAEPTDSISTPNMPEMSGRFPENVTPSLPALFVKTHELKHAQTGNKAIHLVRDGRDAIVSHAHYDADLGRSHVDGRPFGEALDLAVDGVLPTFDPKRTVWDWSLHTIVWQRRPSSRTLTVWFEYLIRFPKIVAAAVAAFVGWEHGLRNADSELRDFASLHKQSPHFFRRGKVGGWRDELGDAQHERFWRRHGQAMQLLGYSREGEPCS